VFTSQSLFAPFRENGAHAKARRREEKDRDIPLCFCVVQAALGRTELAMHSDSYNVFASSRLRVFA